MMKVIPEMCHTHDDSNALHDGSYLMQHTKLFAYVNNNIHDIKRILQDKQFHLQLKSEQKEIIQNVLERKDSMAVSFRGYRILFSIRNPYINRFTNHFSIHS
jgi:hypothetical protein